MPEPLSLDSKITEVHLYRSGAVVRRVAALEAKAFALAASSEQELRVVGLPLTVAEESVRVWLAGGAAAALVTPADTRVELVLPSLGASLVTSAEAELSELALDIERLDERLLRIDFELEQLGTTKLGLSAPFKDQPPKPAPVKAWLELSEFFGEQKRRLLAERVKTQEERRLLEEQRLRLQRQQATARAREDAVGDAVSKRVVFRLRGQAPTTEIGDPVMVVVEYCVVGARWAPAYVFRMHKDGTRAELSQRALVVQQTGEAWTQVRLSLSTADLTQETQLPELPSLRLGRTVTADAGTPWRDPPVGVETLFEGLDGFFTRAARPAGARITPAQAPRLLTDADMSLCGDKLRFAQPVEACAPAAPPAPELLAPPAPSLAQAEVISDFAARAAAPEWEEGPAKRGRMLKNKRHAAPPAASRASAMVASASAAPATATLMAANGCETRELRYGRLLMVDWQDPERRGKLRPRTLFDELPDASRPRLEALATCLHEAETASRRVEQVVFPPGSEPFASSCGSYDYRYRAEGLVDVPSDGVVHNVPVASHEASVDSTLVVVPRETQEAVRVARIKNPLCGPLLAGTVDVYLADEFLVTTPIRSVPAGGELTIGLGVEEALKVARNTSFEEDRAGLLRGSLLLKHTVSIEVASRLGCIANVEVRERVPIKDEDNDEVAIETMSVKPPWEPFEQLETEPIKGGKRWRFALAPGETKRLGFTYGIKIEAKSEVVGGNRRET